MISIRRRVLPLLLALGLASCPPTPPPEPPGNFLGSFLFTGQLLAAGEDGGTPGSPWTTCALDGGPLTPAISLSFYASLSSDPDGGLVSWQLEGGLPESGVLEGAGFQVVIQSAAPVPGCGCVGAVAETIAAHQLTLDGGSVDGGFVRPIVTLTGWLDDRLTAASNVDLSAVSGEGAACLPDAGGGCALGCDLVYSLTGVPGQPGQ